MSVPRWLISWAKNNGGISSYTIVRYLIPGAHDFGLGLLQGFDGDAPHDASDVVRCVRLLDVAERNGLDLRAEMPRLAEHPKWGPVATHWSIIEAALKLDRAESSAEDRRCLYKQDGVTPRKRRLKRRYLGPCRTYVLLEHLRPSMQDYPQIQAQTRDRVTRFDAVALLRSVGVEVPDAS